MRKFIVTATVYLASICVLVVVLVVVSKQVAYEYINLRIPKSKDVLIVGNSATRTSLNDKIIENSYNMSHNAISNFYTHLQVREIIKRNKHISKVVFSYDYANLVRNKDRFLNDSYFIRQMLPKFFVLMNYEEVFQLLRIQPMGVLTSLHSVIQSNFTYSLRRKGNYSKMQMGGFNPANKLRLEDTRKHYAKMIKYYDVEPQSSVIQKKHLIELYHLCLNTNVELVLFTKPHKKEFDSLSHRYKPEYFSFKNKFLPHAILLDYGHFPLPDTCYSDFSHLMPCGADALSSYINEYGYIHYPPQQEDDE